MPVQRLQQQRPGLPGAVRHREDEGTQDRGTDELSRELLRFLVAPVEVVQDEHATVICRPARQQCADRQPHPEPRVCGRGRRRRKRVGIRADVTTTGHATMKATGQVVPLAHMGTRDTPAKEAVFGRS